MLRSYIASAWARSLFGGDTEYAGDDGWQLVGDVLQGAHKHETDFEEKKKSTSVAIKNGRVKIQAEIADMKSKLDLAKRTTLKFREEIKKAQKEKGVEQTMF